ncbi:acetyl-CoA C-acyltransferase family protein [Solimonas marina]|uniref:Acetyl-CoA C-acyltransferase family protein n=1 Tax=Solimonas marina TaxID=2714601 RepID=A0A970BA39_9GAMM|nr:acetyl-CoA C-acyltransferase family protein [Solimonas marina]NKF22986.1 acetyl-CoA C-acyltransferase family protein [Solimonas marina]
MSMPEVWVLAAARTAIGSFGGSLKEVPLSDLATTVLLAAIARSGVRAQQVGHVVIGNVIPTEPHDAYLSRIAAVRAGVPLDTPALNVNRLCGSGLQAIITAAQTIAMGDTDIAIGAGAESMTRGPYLLPMGRFADKCGEQKMRDFMTEILHDPFERCHMGVTAENIARRYGITREDQDVLVNESQRRATQAIREGRFTEQIVPVEIETANGAVRFDTDEHVRSKTTMQSLARLKPAFQAGGVVTVGNTAGVNDGAAALVLASPDGARQSGLQPVARLLSYAHAGVEPAYMGMGPVPATRLALKRAGLRVEDLDVIESNESYAAQGCAVMRELGLDPDRVNPNGSGISLGHPVGATGAIIATKAIHELHRTGGRYALATMCIGGGQGIAAIFERL